MWNWESIAVELDISTQPNDFLNIGAEITDKICEKGFGDKTAVLCRSKLRWVVQTLGFSGF